MPIPRETELKLEPDLKAGDGLVQRLSDALGVAPESPKRLKTTYFDTRKRALQRRGLALRIRSDNGRLTQTLKASTGAGTFDRSEWESDAVDGAPDAERFEEKTPRKALRARGTLRPLFATHVDRTVWAVQQGASLIEVSVDLGEVRAEDATASLAEVELELKSGSAGDLFGLARRLASVEAFRIGVQSKSERGFALLDSDQRAAVKADRLRLTPDMSAGTAFQIIARSCLRQFRLNEPVLVQARKADSLHQARVAIRRLRSSLSLFRSVVADETMDGIRRGLKELSTLLGQARNLDVYRAHVVDPALERGPTSQLDSYALRIEQEREAAYDRVCAKLSSPAFRMFVLELAEWIETGAWTMSADTARDRSVADFAPRVLRKRARIVAKKGRHLAHLTPTARHKVRIAAKNLRYASDFFSALVTSKRAGREHRSFIESLERLQETLGTLNDVCTGRETAETVIHADEGAPASTFPASLVTKTEDDLVRAAVAAHATFAKTKTPLIQSRK